jgi:hypothetical protein
MATLYGVNATKIAAMKPSNILDAGSSGGKVRCFIDTYTGLGTESASDVIKMGPELPVGAKILFMVLTQTATGNTPDVGDAESSERYISEAADNAVHVSDAITGGNYEIDMTDADNPDNQILILLDAAVTLAGTMKLVVFYTVE